MSAMATRHTVLSDFEDGVPRGSGLDKLRGYKLYEEGMAVFEGTRQSWSIPPWKRGDGSNDPYMLFYGDMEIWTGAVVRLRMKDGRKFTLMSLEARLEDQFSHQLDSAQNSTKAFSVNIRREGDSLEVSCLSLGGDPVAQPHHFHIDDKVETLRAYIRDEIGLVSARFFCGSEEIQDVSDISRFDSLVVSEQQLSRTIKCLEVSGSNMEKKRYEERSASRKRRLMEEGIDVEEEPVNHFQPRMDGKLIFTDFEDVEWIDLASENAKVHLRKLEFVTGEREDNAAVQLGD